MKKLALAFSALALILPGAAAADEDPFGAHVSQCAQIHLPPVDPPSIVCVHDGHTHEFANFGEMVRHMLGHHG